MRNEGLEKASGYIKKRRLQKRWQKAVTCLAAVVVFCTVYALILPAITMEKEQTLNCIYEVHQHEESCYDTDRNVVCGYADYVVHTHDADYCYDADGNLVCKLAEIKEHVHDASCYEERTAPACGLEESSGHEHDASCYTSEQGPLICENAEEGHEHTDECYEWTETLTCGLDDGDGAHAHTDGCYTTEEALVCEKPEAILHTHTDGCYEDILDDSDEVVGKQLICGKLQVEEHTHTEDCFSQKDPAVEEVIALIDALPAQEEIEENLAAFEDDEDGYDAYLTEIVTQAKAAYEAYSALSEEQQAQITNVEKLMALEPFWSAQTLAGDNGFSVTALSIDSTLTGTTAYWDKDDSAGNDSSAANDIVRTFDTIAYTFEVSVNNEENKTGDTVKLWLEITLDKDMTEAMFDPDYFKDLGEYTITYYDKDGKELATGTNGLPSYSANTHASGSNDENPYRTAVAKQVLTGWMEVKQESAVASFQQTMKAAISVKAACNGDTIQPHFRSWTQGQDKADGKTADSKEITVSAAARYNVRLDRSYTLVYESSFDMSAGTEATENTSDADKVDGLMLGYCVTFQLYNNGDENKGLMGIELPRGEISANISFEESAVSTSDGLDLSKNFTPILWDYRTDGNVASTTTTKGAWGRELKWGGMSNTDYARWDAPGNKRANANDTQGSSYDGGSWSMSEDYKDSWKNASGAKSGPYTITVSGYDFDLDSFIFPDRTQGTTTVVYADNIGCFSTGYMEVLLQYDSDQIDSLNHSTSLYMTATVDGFKATSMSSQTANDVTTEMTYEDNQRKGTITVKNPGAIEKYNSIADKAVTGDIQSGYMGIAGKYWTGECGDPATFAGSEVHLAGQFVLGSAASLTITDFNSLQVFDSAGFSINGTPQVAKQGNITLPANKTTFLYAADPDYPGGYDSNASAAYTDENGKMVAPASHMYKVKESDLIYFGSLDDLEKAGYTCIGVMLEARGIEMNPSTFAGLTIPVKITDHEDMIGKTICTVNRVAAWTDNKAASLTYGKATTESEAKANAANVTSSEVYKNPKYLLDPSKVVNSSQNKPASKYDYIKTEYENGSIVTGTHLNGLYGGMSILILGYEASLNLDTADEKAHYNLGQNERTADYVISQIQTTVDSKNAGVLDPGTPMTTDLTVTVKLDQGLTLDLATLQMGGKQILSDTYKDSPDAKRSYTYTANDGKQYTVEYIVYYTYDAATQTATIQIKGVPVGITLEDVTFSAAIGKLGAADDVKDGDKLTVVATITGSADRRAYSEVAGNLRTKTIDVSNLTGSSLVKTVDHSYIELNGSFAYTLKYTNNGTDPMTNTLYLYDILPVNGDTRGSSYTDASDNNQVGITGLSASVTGGGGGATSAQMRVYYSTVPGSILNGIIDFRQFPESDTQGACLRQLLGNALTTENGGTYFFQNNGKNVDLYTYSSTGQITARNFTLGDNDKGYTVNSVTATYDSFVKVTGYEYVNGELVIHTEAATFAPDTYTKMFRYLGDITPGGSGITDSTGSQSVSDFTHATCIFAAAVNLGAGETINFEIDVAAEGNNTGDLYGNTAHSWISGTPPTSELDSNMVTTRVVSRTVSGRVWHDTNLNGVQDAGEKTISGVTCTLFQWDAAANKYVLCTTDVTGGAIDPVVTGADGAYCFEKLAAGDYIVAFSGDVLDQYTGATFYQKNSANDSNTNDGVALGETKSSLDTDSISLAGIDGSTYKYAIAYRLNSSDSTVEKLVLHPIYDANGNLQITQYLNNHVEQYTNQDLGLIIAGYELPETGGTGTTLYTIGGLLLLAGAGILLMMYNHKKRRKEDPASS